MNIDNPSEPRFLSAEWRYLAMLNYEIDPALLQPHVPYGCELDSWNGRTFASMVGFRFVRTRVLGIPIPGHINFDEVNLRFYVRRKGEEGWRRGVVFIKEIVPRFAIARLARLIYNEQYVSMPMRHRIDIENGTLIREGGAEYSWRFRGIWNRLAVKSTGEARPAEPGSEEEFITEHYWGYSAQRDGGTVEYRVMHPSWNIWQVSQSALECDIPAIYGAKFREALSGPPSSAFLADGSAISVHMGKRIRRG
ncbi:MAG: DUF2071 domain-containing protein [Candidatus Kapaibacterium sp.]